MNQEVDIVFTRASGLIAWLIRTFTRSQVSHVMIQTDFYGRPMYMHADIPRVRLETTHKAMRGREELYRFRCRGNIKKAASMLGSEYDTLGLFGFFVFWLAKWFRIKTKNPFARAGAVWCSEFVTYLDLPEFEGVDPELLTPKGLLEICKKGASFRPV